MPETSIKSGDRALGGAHEHVNRISAGAGSAESRNPAIRLELFSSIMHSYRALPVFFPVVTGALALTLDPAAPAWLIAVWWIVIVAIHAEYHFFQHRYFDADISPEEASGWIRATATRYWLMNFVWLALFPLFWDAGGDLQNFAILMVFIVHVVMASQTAFQIMPITI